MRRARTLFWMLAAALCFASTPAAATSVTVLITGTWDDVTDTAGVLDGSITVGGTFTATLVYDDAVSDLNGDPSIGEYDVLPASSDLSLSTGNYLFSPSSGVGIAIDDDNAFGEDVVFLFAETYVTTGPLPIGISTGGTSFANPTLTDTSGTAHSSDDLTALPWSVGSYDLTSFYFFTGVVGAGAGNFIELQGTITSMSLAVLPEPSAGLLAAVGFIAAVLAGSRRG